MFITIDNIEKSFGDRNILNKASFFVDDKDKIGIVGANGTGKTTLIKMILGEEIIDSGNVSISKGLKIGYLSQLSLNENNNNLYEEIILADSEIINLNNELERLRSIMDNESGESLNMAIASYTRVNSEIERADGYTYFSRAKAILKGLGFEEDSWSKNISSLSGGELTRLSLGKLLLARNDMLILDEPTNHLDMASIEWLESFLTEFKGAIILVSHDRYFMDKIVSKIVELKDEALRTYQGNYTEYSKKQEQVRAAYLKAYENQQRELKHQEEVIAKLKSFNREKSIKRAESRQKQLDKIERLDKLREDDEIRMVFAPNRLSSNRILTVSGLEKSFDNKKIFENVDFEIARGDRVALIGRNGVGKTTILKIINGLIDEYNGKISFGENLDIAYFEQNSENMNPENTIFDEISDSFPTLNNTKIRNALAAFLFTGDEVFKTIASLSGGERGRVALVKLMLSGANFLILDEPTNHLDIASKEILEDAINSYSGTVFYVSHDRFFINKTASRILSLSDSGVSSYLGNYDYYLEKISGDNTDIPVLNDAIEEFSKGALDWRLEKQKQADKRKKENRIKRLEELIEEYEKKIKDLDELLMKDDIASNVSQCMEIHNEHQSLDEKLNEAYIEWNELLS